MNKYRASNHRGQTNGRTDGPKADEELKIMNSEFRDKLSPNWFHWQDIYNYIEYISLH